MDFGIGTVGIYGGLGKISKESDKFLQVSIKDIQDEELATLLPKVIKSDPSIDQAVDFFCTLTTQDHKITCSSDRGQREIDEINQLLEEKKNPLSLSVAHCASSLIMRGDICAETEFTENLEIENFWINDPTWVEWRLLTEKGQTRWALGHYKNSKWVEIDSPNIYYLSANPLIGERVSRSPLQTALFPAVAQSAMVNSLQRILESGQLVSMVD